MYRRRAGRGYVTGKRFRGDVISEKRIKQTRYQHWQLEKEEPGILWLLFNRAEHAVNTIDREVLNELESILDEIIRLRNTPASLSDLG